MSSPAVLLLTDIVDSTRLSERLGDAAMGVVWARHDEVARELLRVWRGSEIDRSDGFLMRFSAVPDALCFAIDYHRALAALDEPLRARIGIHVGPLLSRENSEDDIARGAKAHDVGGLAIPVTARVMSLATGGQTLLTAEAKDALGGSTHRVVSHGCWRMKGAEAPFELFEAGDADAPFTPPPDGQKVYCVVRRNDLWIPRRSVLHSLPAERNAFIGRAQPLAQLASRFRDGARLISVLGPGGNGKTRLAQRFGWKWLGDFEGGVWFCDLSQATTLDEVVAAVALGLGVPLGTGSPIEQVGAAMAGRGGCLVILDNFEQIAALARETIGYWLDRAVDARFIVTTRNVLSVDGEEVLSLAQMRIDEGAALFVQRAQSAKVGFELPEAERPLLHALIALLEGLPLAIELAAARIRIMSIEKLVERMDERFRLLASQTGRNDRHATLRATLDWSWDLLSPCDRAALAQASVFEGGFGLAAFEAVVDLAAFDDAPELFEVLQSLVDKSWVQQSGETRFGLLKSMQEYAGERLAAAGSFDGSGEADRLAALRRHWHFYASLSEEEAVADGYGDLDNFMHACRRATSAGDAAAAAGALESAWHILKLSGPFQAIVPLATDVRDMPELSVENHALIGLVLGSALLMLGSTTDAETCFDDGLNAARSARHGPREVMLRAQLGTLQVATGRTASAIATVEAAMKVCETLDDQMLRCVALNALGSIHQTAGALEDARRYYTFALAIARACRDRRWEGGLLGNLGGVNYGLGHLAEARRNYEQSLELVQETGDRRWEGNTRCNLGLISNDQGRPNEAREHLESALSNARRLGHRKLECTVLCNLGILAEAESQLEDARLLYQDGLDIAIAISNVRYEGQCNGYLGLLQGRLGDKELAAATLARARELLITGADPWNLVLVLCGMVEVAVATRRFTDARRYFDEAETALAGIGATASSPLTVALTRADEALRAAEEPAQPLAARNR